MKKTNIKAAFAVFLLIAAAVLCRIASYNISLPFPARILDFTRTLIYIGLFSVWGFSINKRVVHRQTKRLLLAVCLLEIFWLTIREFKYRFVFDTDALRGLWYLYYIPTILVPLLALYISMLLAKPEAYRLSKKAILFAVPSTALLLLMLSNDFHQLAFRFPEGAVKSEQSYTYGIVYFLTVIWAVICSLSSFTIMLMRSRLPKNRKSIPLPLIPIAAALVYSILYALRLEFILRSFGDVAVVFCLVFTAFFECCIQCGLIQTNTRYSSLFSATKDISVIITDNEYTAKYASRDAENFSISDMKKAEGAPIIIDNKKRLNNMKVYGGRALWSEDISEILALSQTLKDTQEELKELSSLLFLEYEKEKKHKTVEEQNRLYDLLQRKTQPQLNQIDSLMKKYKAASSETEKQKILANILVIGTFIKRRKDFVLSMEYANEFPELMLSSALNESFRALKLLGIKGSFLVNSKRELVSSKTLSLAYDFFEDIVEAVIDEAHYINFLLCEVGGRLRISILTDCKNETTALFEKYPDMAISEDEDSLALLLKLEGGDGI